MSAKKLLLSCVCCLLQACAPGDNSSSSPAIPANTLFPAAAQQRLQQVAEELEQASDLRAIKRLEHNYAQYLSSGRWQDAATMFAADAKLIEGERQASGNTEISARLQQLTGALPGQGLATGHLFETFVLSSVLNLAPSGTEAYGRWRSITLLGEYRDSANWHIGINENRYVKQNGSWKFAELHHYPLFAGSHAEGWRNLKQETQEEVTPVPFHYNVTEAGIPAPPVTAVSSIVLPDAEAAALLQQLEALSQQLLDEDAIINLQHAYGYYLDRKMWDDLVELFTPQGSFEFAQTGVYRGHDSIRRALELFGPAGLPADEVFDHVQMQPVVVVAADGLTARARGVELQMLGKHEGDSQLGVAVYVNDYRKTADRWMLDKVQVHTRLLTAYQQGWALDAQPAPVAAPSVTADAAPSQTYGAYPEFFVPGFLPARIAAAPAIHAKAVTADDLLPRLNELARRVRVLDAWIGTENVANAYGYSIDEFLWDDMADLFSVEGWKELSYIGRYTGRERIRQSVVDRYGRGGRRANSMTFHQKTQPVISVSEDGLSASIRTRLFQLNSSVQAAGSYMSGIYENTAIKENGVWKLASMDLDYAWSANFIGGWSAVAAGSFDRLVPAPGSLTGPAAPDAPLRGIITPPYPTAPVDMAFHYRNPVSGREPPILLQP